jgi:hypothetical protein
VLSDRLIRTGLVVAASAILIQTAAHVANELWFDGRYGALDATQDGNVFTWMSSVATFAGAFAAAVAAISFGRHRRQLGLLASLLAFLSLDDAVGLHERLEHLTDGTSGMAGRAGGLVFLALYLPLLLAALVLLVRTARCAPSASRACINAGLALLVASVALRLVAAVVRLAGAELADGLRLAGVTATQDAELGGWVLIASGLTATLCVMLSSRPPARAT